MSEPKSQSTQDRRESDRQRSHQKVTVRIAATEIEGNAENISKSGVLLHTEGTLEVVVAIEEDGATREVPGRLVRSERIHGTRQGWALEFAQ